MLWKRLGSYMTLAHAEVRFLAPFAPVDDLHKILVRPDRLVRIHATAGDFVIALIGTGKER